MSRSGSKCSSEELEVIIECVKKTTIKDDLREAVLNYSSSPSHCAINASPRFSSKEPSIGSNDNHDERTCAVESHVRILDIDSDGKLLRRLSFDRDELAAADVEAVGKLPCEEDYESIKLISNGAYGAVYLVRHKETRQRFAMKKINKHSLVLRNQVEQVFAERDIMSFSDNPFMVSMFCSFETKRYLCMVMEYVEGGDCATLLKNIGPLPVDMARFYFGETVLAVDYLHSYGIVHRDLKPDNLLITGMGHIKLTDFGLSKIGLMNLATNLTEGFLERDTKQFNDKQVFGTPEYIAPEVILRQGYGKPVDWWAMGIILYEFLIGCVPFFGETTEELFAHVISDEIDWPDNDEWPLPDEAKSLIVQLLQRNPLDRLGTCGANEVKNNAFFVDINWDALLRQKAEFIPHLEDEEDTSYFDTRTDRYNHEMEHGDSDEQEETDDSMFSSFSSCSPRYHQVYSRIEKELAQEKLMKSSSTSSISDESSKPNTPTESNLMRTRSVNEGRTTPSKLALTYKPSPLSCSPTDSAKVRRQDKVEILTSSSETDAVKVQRRKNTSAIKGPLPRFSISLDVDEKGALVVPQTLDGAIGESSDSGASGSGFGPYHSSPRIPIPSPYTSLKGSPRSRSVTKSASASGLSLIIPTAEEVIHRTLVPAPQSPGHSSASSREASPSRGLATNLCSQLKPLIIIRKSARGFGFTLRAIRVYYGDSDVYTVHHLVMAVETNSPAFEAGLQPGDLITHINSEPIQGLLHHQVLQLVLSGGDKISIRATPLEHTTIKTGGRKRNPVTSKMVRRKTLSKHKKSSIPVKRTDSDKKRKSASLLRRLSNRRASADIQQLVIASSCATPSSPVMTPSCSVHSFGRASAASSATPSKDSGNQSPLANSSPFNWHLLPTSNPSNRLLRSPPANRLPCSPSDSPAATSSQSSSPGSSNPNSPANLSHSPHCPRPSSLHGLKHKLVQRWSPRRKSNQQEPHGATWRHDNKQVLSWCRVWEQ
ncbi:Microtubule-associated serine/threonine-protein kinase 3 [Halotydeus destructor]|nr:Microtubule-associated serine/threonine-protein kinase 3 [Halotydeus destructor]